MRSIRLQEKLQIQEKHQIQEKLQAQEELQIQEKLFSGFVVYVLCSWENRMNLYLW